MAGLVRFRSLQGFRKSISLLIKQQNFIRAIGTSSKKNVTREVEASSETQEETSSEIQPVRKNWVSWGFNDQDEKLDRHLGHNTFFFMVTIGLVFSAYFTAFMPNTHMVDWGQREAYLELRRREELGLPPIDKDYFDPATIILPTDEELGDTEIII